MKKKVSKLDVYVVLCIASVFIFTIVNQVMLCFGITINDTLITCFYATFGGEMLSCALIKVLKLKKGSE